MAGQLRLLIETHDRVGMVHDALHAISDLGLSLTAVEVTPGRIWLKLRGDETTPLSELRAALRSVSGVLAVQRAELLPSEERERRLRAVLDAVSEGILAVDESGIVTTINPIACEILQTSEAEALGRPVGEILSPEVPMLRTLKTGAGYTNREIILRRDRGRSHYLTTGRAILDEDGRTIGAVAAIKNMADVRDLAYSLTAPATITFRDIIGGSPILTNAINLARTVARGGSTILIRGESGTGKELFARAIHSESPRHGKPFVPINCAALPDALLESELFGYEEGAFTGAKRGGKQGLFEFAQDGTVFLDEIGELPAHLQAKLLRVLQENRVRRVGGNEEMPINVRVIAATSRDLEQLVATGDFRADLYYRLNVIPLYLPPLRERPSDIAVLARHFIDQLNPRLGTSISGLGHEAIDRLLAHPWPGNVRELANVIERGMNLAQNGELGAANIVFGRPVALLAQTAPTIATDGVGTLDAAAAAAEREVLARALAEHGSARKAAQALGVSHTTVLKKMRRYGLKP
jgi:transcriptional regulator of aroF, aroG, tyrA and aromatic amino acid transport